MPVCEAARRMRNTPFGRQAFLATGRLPDHHGHFCNSDFSVLSSTFSAALHRSAASHARGHVLAALSSEQRSFPYTALLSIRTTHYVQSHEYFSTCDVSDPYRVTDTSPLRVPHVPQPRPSRQLFVREARVRYDVMLGAFPSPEKLHTSVSAKPRTL